MSCYNFVLFLVICFGILRGKCSLGKSIAVYLIHNLSNERIEEYVRIGVSGCNFDIRQYVVECGRRSLKVGYIEYDIIP